MTAGRWVRALLLLVVSACGAGGVGYSCPPGYRAESYDCITVITPIYDGSSFMLVPFETCKHRCVR